MLLSSISSNLMFVSLTWRSYIQSKQTNVTYSQYKTWMGFSEIKQEKIIYFCTPGNDIYGTTPKCVDIYLWYYTYLLEFHLYSVFLKSNLVTVFLNHSCVITELRLNYVMQFILQSYKFTHAITSLFFFGMFALGYHYIYSILKCKIP